MKHDKERGMSIMWNDGLFEEQENVASLIGSHVCLLAGPGTGKTLCLTRRVCYLIEEEHINPESILVLTFTRAAASELRNRISRELDDNQHFPNIATLHSFALSTILGNYEGERLPQPIRIADDYEERFIIQEEIKRILNIDKIDNVKALFNQLSADWESLTAEEGGWEERFPNPAFLGAWREHRMIYGYTLRSELVYQLKHLLDEGAIDFNERYQYVQVDEYQDLNACDLAVIQMIADSGVELYAAGDDDQSIYGFRSANPEGIRNFNHDYQNSETHPLTECIRCDQNILSLSLFVARQDPRRMDKELVCCDDADEGEVNIIGFEDQDEEANGIARICEWLINEEDIQPSEIIILLRSDRNRIFSSVISGALRGRGLHASTVSNPLACLDTPEGRQFYCLLKLIANSHDSLAWRTLLEVRRNRIGETAFNSLYELALNRGVTFFDAIVLTDREPNIMQRFRSRISAEFQTISQILDAFDLENYDNLFDLIETLAIEHVNDLTIRQEILNIFSRIFENYEIVELENLLRVINVSMQNLEQERDVDTINIMTMHQAKGLSADAVFIAVAEDEYIPGKNEGQLLGDERRLLYVSLTRARNYLYITHCQNRTGAQRHSGRRVGKTRRHLTRFLSGGPIRSTSGTNFFNNL